MKFSIKHDQRGNHAVMIVIIVVVIALIGAVGYKVLGTKNTSKTSSNTTASTSKTATAKTPAASTSSAEAACLTHYHDTDLCKFEAAALANPLDKMAYTAQMTTVTNGTKTSLTYIQDGKGNNRITSSDGTLNSVEFNGATYVETNGVWYKYGSSAPTQTTDPSSSLDWANSITSTKFTKVGTVACSPDACLKYSISDPSIQGTAYALLDTKTEQMREFMSTDTSGNSLDMKLSYGAVSITAPSPVQDITSPTQ